MWALVTTVDDDKASAGGESSVSEVIRFLKSLRFHLVRGATGSGH
jgi:hypothetical protein